MDSRHSLRGGDHVCPIAAFQERYLAREFHRIVNMTYIKGYQGPLNYNFRWGRSEGHATLFRECAETVAGRWQQTPNAHGVRPRLGRSFVIREPHSVGARDADRHRDHAKEVRENRPIL